MTAIAETIKPLSHRVHYFVVWLLAQFWTFGRLVCTGYSVPTVIARAGIDAVVRGREIYGKLNGVEGYIDASGATFVVMLATAKISGHVIIIMAFLGVHS